MKNMLIALMIAVVAFVGLYSYASTPISPASNGSDVQTGLCDASHPCPSGQECYKFQDDPSPVCYIGNPCDRCPSRSCLVMESYPAQIACQQ